jgi:hypothetical protein
MLIEEKAKEEALAIIKAAAIKKEKADIATRLRK